MGGSIVSALRPVEIARIQADRARNLAAKSAPTIPTEPWPKTQTSALSEVATRAMQGSYNVSDIRFMALALLQMSDTLAELRERVKRLENGATPTV